MIGPVPFRFVCLFMPYSLLALVAVVVVVVVVAFVASGTVIVSMSYTRCFKP